MTADGLRPLYRMWDRLTETWEKLDPQGRLLNPYLRRLLGA